MYENEKEIAMLVAAKVYDGMLKGGAVIRMERFIELFMTEIVGSKCVDCASIYMSRIDSQREQLEALKHDLGAIKERLYDLENPETGELPTLRNQLAECERDCEILQSVVTSDKQDLIQQIASVTAERDEIFAELTGLHKIERDKLLNALTGLYNYIGDCCIQASSVDIQSAPCHAAYNIIAKVTNGED